MRRGKGKERFWRVLVVWFSSVFGFCLFWFFDIIAVILGQVRWGFEQPSWADDVPARGRRLE